MTTKNINKEKKTYSVAVGAHTNQFWISVYEHFIYTWLWVHVFFCRKQLFIWCLNCVIGIHFYFHSHSKNRYQFEYQKHFPFAIDRHILSSSEWPNQTKWFDSKVAVGQIKSKLYTNKWFLHIQSVIVTAITLLISLIERLLRIRASGGFSKNVLSYSKLNSSRTDSFHSFCYWNLFAPYSTLTLPKM